MNQQHPHHPSIVHPLQDLPGMSPAPSTSAATPSPQLTTTNPAAALTSTSTGGSWTSSFASFASRAAASVQTAVESAEAAVLQTSGSAGGIPAHAGAPVGGIRIAHNSHLQQQSLGGVTQQGGSVGVQHQGAGVQPAGSKQGMSYQERQRLLHQQYHANNASKQSPIPSMNSRPLQQQAAVPRRSPPNSGGIPVQPSAVAPSSPQKTQPSQPSAPTTPASVPEIAAAPTFLDKLTTSLDTPTKTKLISSALGPLLPGERVIMFLNSLKDVRDSTFGQVFVGSGNVLRSRGMEILCEGISVDDGDVVNGSFGEEGGNGGGVTTVWCCVMTFYRVAVFSYRATLDGKVLLDSDGSNSSSSQGGSDSNGSNVGKEEMIQQWLHSQNVSIQFQAAHCPPPSTNSSSNQSASKQTHHVFQMPLASIERVEKTLASSQKAMASNYTTGVTSNGVGYASGYSAILPSSSTVSSTMTSTASSAMVSLGSQMKPLLGGMASSTSNSNLLTNGDTNLAGTGHSARGTTGTTPTGPLGIVLHGKDGGRWIRFSTSNYTDAQRAHEALNTYAFPGRRNLGYLFAFESRRAEVMASSNAQQQQQGGGGQPQNVEGGNPIATAAAPTRRRFVPLEEFERQGNFQPRGTGVGGAAVGGGNSMGAASPWAPILNANANYGLCSTYPSVLVGPRSIVGGTNDPIDGPNGSSHHSQSPNTNENIGLLRRCAAFRSENRFPALTWGSKEDGGSIWRSSQPKVGLQGNRSPEDERYLYAIGEEAKRANLAADARSEGGVGGGTSGKAPSVEFLRMLCGRNNESDLILSSEIGGGGSSAGGCMLKIMDMRPKSAAMGNRTQGYGYENTNNYRGTTINFYGIGNIHAVRDAYQKVNTLCLNPNTSDLQWMQLVENTNWPSIIRLILSASWQTAFHVHYNRLPVLVHCSHGWDRTSQVPALAQLLLDPFYRTREGFSTLVEKDFLSFGHPFHTRCGHGEGKNEQGGDEGQLSPIFLQFLDCVFQLVNQFPDYFEFNSRYLLLLSEHVYSCRFGTLLCDSEREREVVAGTRQRTYCMWDYLDSIPELVNPTFDKAASERAGVLLMPLPMLLRNVTLWTDRYCMYGAKAVMPPGLGHAYPPTYVVQCPAEQALVLHTIRNGVEGTLRRALEDAEMWRETALAALNEVKELKKKKEQHANDASKD